MAADRCYDVVTILEPVAKRRPSYTVFADLGFCLAGVGRRAEGVAMMERAIAMDPGDYWAYYALDYSHVRLGHPADAIPVFERLLRVRPVYPEIEQLLRRLREGKRE